MDEMMAKKTILDALDEIEAEVTSWRRFFANTKSGWRWIPCSERLPEYGEAVLTINEDEDYEINHIIDEDNGEWFCDGVIAWMPLPEPYKGDDK